MTTSAHGSQLHSPASPLNGEHDATFAAVRNAATLAPPLHRSGAQTLVRDRWERLVTAIDLPQSPESVWAALTDPDTLAQWFAVCHGSLTATERDCMLDFEDGEFFLCRPLEVDPPHRLTYLWRWLGIGQASSVTWDLAPTDDGTRVTVTEEAVNPPWDWQTWNGGGWTGILDQLAAHLRTGTEWRWPWRRVGPYAQVELAMPPFVAWDHLMSPSSLRFWLQITAIDGVLSEDQTLTVFMGDASGAVTLTVDAIVQPGEVAPSFLPHLDFTLRRPVWETALSGRMWMEPAGWGRSLFQVVHMNWENLPPSLQLSERKIVTNFWAGAARRAQTVCAGLPGGASGPPPEAGPHSWS